VTTQLALPWLYEQVTAHLLADGTPVVSQFGWRIPAQQVYGNRIAWVPGDPHGAIGTMGPPRNPGGDPRSLGTLSELFTVTINGQDPAEPENELKQYSIVRYLRDAWYRAVYHVAHGVFDVRYEEWITTRTERRHGAALRIVTELQSAVWDVPYPETGTGYAPPDTGAVIDVIELDVIEQVIVHPTDTP